MIFRVNALRLFLISSLLLFNFGNNEKINLSVAEILVSDAKADQKSGQLKEAADAISDHVNSHVMKKDESFLFFSSASTVIGKFRHIWEVRNIDFSLNPKELSEADKLNGIDNRTSFEMTASVYRGANVDDQQIEWSKWFDGGVILHGEAVKSSGTWEFDIDGNDLESDSTKGFRLEYPSLKLRVLFNESAEDDPKYSKLYAGYAATPISELVKNTEAMKLGERLYVTHCTECHGSDGRGDIGYPNLTDNDWLWGGSPNRIKESIMNGRTGNMPSRGGLPLTDDEVDNVAEYVMSLAGRDVDQTASGLGRQVFGKICLACHLPTGAGNQALGAANLTDSTWLYGSQRSEIVETIKNGRTGVMSGYGPFLGENKVHLLAAYVYRLSM